MTNQGELIYGLSDLCQMVGCAETKEALDKAIYKGTNCGAWIEVDEEKVMIGSIVEGCDAYPETQTLRFPFNKHEFWDAVREVDDEACEIWDDVHAQDDF